MPGQPHRLSPNHNCPEDFEKSPARNHRVDDKHRPIRRRLWEKVVCHQNNDHKQEQSGSSEPGIHHDEPFLTVPAKVVNLDHGEPNFVCEEPRERPKKTSVSDRSEMKSDVAAHGHNNHDASGNPTHHQVGAGTTTHLLDQFALGLLDAN